jgi:hypothetical protein
MKQTAMKIGMPIQSIKTIQPIQSTVGPVGNVDAIGSVKSIKKIRMLTPKLTPKIMTFREFCVSELATKRSRWL